MYTRAPGWSFLKKRDLAHLSADCSENMRKMTALEGQKMHILTDT